MAKHFHLYHEYTKCLRCKFQLFGIAFGGETTFIASLEFLSPLSKLQNFPEHSFPSFSKRLPVSTLKIFQLNFPAATLKILEARNFVELFFCFVESLARRILRFFHDKEKDFGMILWKILLQP